MVWIPKWFTAAAQRGVVLPLVANNYTLDQMQGLIELHGDEREPIPLTVSVELRRVYAREGSTAYQGERGGQRGFPRGHGGGLVSDTIIRDFFQAAAAEVQCTYGVLSFEWGVGGGGARLFCDLESGVYSVPACSYLRVSCATLPNINWIAATDPMEIAVSVGVGTPQYPRRPTVTGYSPDVTVGDAYQLKVANYCEEIEIIPVSATDKWTCELIVQNASRGQYLIDKANSIRYPATPWSAPGSVYSSALKCTNGDTATRKLIARQYLAFG